MDKIKVEDILQKWQCAGLMEDLPQVKLAIKELIELAIDKAAENQKVIINEDKIPTSVKRKKLPIDYYSETSSQVTVYGDKQSILNVKQMFDEISLEFILWFNSVDSKSTQKEFPGDHNKIFDHWISNIYKPKEND